MNIIGYKDFVEVTTDKLEEVQLPIGSIVFVAGTQSIPEDKNDLYTLRTKLIVCRMDGHHVLNDKFLMIDPRNVKKVEQAKQKKLVRILEQDFKKEE